MHRVFLVEDEIVARESIRDNVAWNRNGFELVGEAADGEMALPLIEETRPDILITDIKMPFMDGLALSRIVRKNYPWVKIILISGYDEFTYAREAISITVNDYLLKPLSAGDLLKSLETVGLMIDEETREREKTAVLTAKLDSSARLMAERFLSDLATGLVPSGDAIEHARRLGIDLVGKRYIVALLGPSAQSRGESERRVDGDGVYREYLKAESLVDRLLVENPEVLKFSPSLKQAVLIFKGDDSAALESRCYSVCHSLKYEVERKTACTLAISVGGVRDRIQGIAESYREALHANSFGYIFGDSSVIGIGDAERAHLRSGDFRSFDGEEILSCLRRGERADLESCLDAFLVRLQTADLGAFLRSHAVVNLSLGVVKFMEELGGNTEPFVLKLDALKLCLETEDAGGLKRILAEFLETAFDFRENRRSNKYSDLVERAKEFIEASFENPDISLNEVAAQVNVSPSHFSTIFSHDTGQTFIDFLTKTRMTKAMELLKSTALRSSEIAYAVGYNDPHYFSYIFKSKVGLTPTEFRQGKVPEEEGSGRGSQ